MIKAINTSVSEQKMLYGPAALLNAFGNSLTLPILEEVLMVKGIYRKGKGVSYNGLYYDILKDEFTDSSLTLVVPERIRQGIREGQVIQGVAYLSKRLSPAVGRVDLLLNLTDILSKEDKLASPEELRAHQIIQLKAQAGFRDVNQLVKTKLYKQTPVSITILMGTTAIIDQDIKHQLKDAVSVYSIRYVKINLTRSIDIIQAMRENDGQDILVITRGGGENLQVFDNPDISQQALDLKSAFITAIGHAADDPLLQKVADKYFITPTALGQYFHDLYVQSMEELTESKAKLIIDLTKQIEFQFQSKLQDMNMRLMESAQSMQAATSAREAVIKELADQLSRSKSSNMILRILLIVLSVLIFAYLLFSAFNILN